MRRLALAVPLGVVMALGVLGKSQASVGVPLIEAITPDWSSPDSFWDVASMLMGGMFFMVVLDVFLEPAARLYERLAEPVVRFFKRPRRDE